MKTRTVKLLLLAMLFVLPLAGFSQERGDRATMEQRQKEQQDKLKKDLKLDKKQAAAFDKAQETYNKKRQEMMTEMRNGGGDFEGMREKMGKLREGLDADLKKILDEKQMKEYEKIQKERAAARGQRGQGRGGQGQGRGGRI